MSDKTNDANARIESLMGEAFATANRFKSSAVTVAHLLYVLAGSEEGRRLIEELGGNATRIRSFLERAFDQKRCEGLAVQTLGFDELLEKTVNATLSNAEANGRRPEIAEILRALMALNDDCLMTRQALAIGGVIETLNDRVDDDCGLDEEDNLDDAIDPADLTPFDDDRESLARIVGKASAPQGRRADPAGAPPEAEVDEHVKAVLAATRDLTSLASQGRLDDVVGVEDEIRGVVDILSKKKKPNVILCGEPGVGKTALVEALAAHLATDAAPAVLAGRPLLEVAIPDLVAGARFRGDFEARMRALMDLARHRRAILFLDEIHLMVGAGASGGRGGMDAANILKPALARGEITVIGATTPDEMRELRRDAALMRRFEAMPLKEPTPQKVRRILDEAVGDYVGHHRIAVDDAMLDLVVDLCERHLPALRFPDKALNVIDQSCVFALGRGADLVEEIDVRRAVERSGGARLTRPDAEMRRRLEVLPEVLSERVFGQEEAVSAVVRSARLSIMGLSAGGTAGAYLFNGPSGVGKTEMAYAVAEGLGFPLVRIDMSEYMEKHAVSRLIGAPPGYVGFDQDGILTRAADTHDDLVLLFDEAEKAHPEVFDILLQILDYGVLRAADGRKLSFRRAHVILSANIGAAAAERPAMGFGRETNAEEVSLEAVEAAFRKELLNRIPHRIQFTRAAPDANVRIARKAIEAARREFADRGIAATFGLGLAEFVAGLGGAGAANGRGIEGTVQSEICLPIVARLLGAPDLVSVEVRLEDGRVVVD